jgi:hypothetical protein
VGAKTEDIEASKKVLPLPLLRARKNVAPRDDAKVEIISPFAFTFKIPFH